MKRIWNSILLICLNLSLTASDHKIIDGQLHEVRAKSGDGIYTLLHRYELHKEPIYHKAFAVLNNLNEKSTLYKHQHYKLPVFLYNYDGKSIRSTIGINDWDKAVRIKEYNERLLAKGSRATHYSDSKILWVPFAEINDEKSSYIPPPLEEVREVTEKKPTPSNKPSTVINTATVTAKVDYAIYGKKYAHLNMVDNSLIDKVFYIVSGHGGPDPGAVCSDCPDRLCEDEYAYDVSLRLAKKLMEHGAIVELVVQDKNDGIRDSRILACDRDERLANGKSLPKDQLRRLQQRTNYINSKYKHYRSKGLKEQVVVSIHVDSNNEDHKQDVFFCYYSGSESSKALADQLRQKFAEKYSIHQKNKKYGGYLKKRNLYILKNTAPPAVLIELANIKNKHNHKRILDTENRQALAKWIFEGLVDKQDTYVSR